LCMPTGARQPIHSNPEFVEGVPVLVCMPATISVCSYKIPRLPPSIGSESVCGFFWSPQYHVNFCTVPVPAWNLRSHISTRDHKHVRIYCKTAHACLCLSMPNQSPWPHFVYYLQSDVLFLLQTDSRRQPCHHSFFLIERAPGSNVVLAPKCV
jgi:hypothetical protein